MASAPLAGELDNFVELRHRILTDARVGGEKIASWPTAYAKVWARKLDLRGNRRFDADQFSTEQLTEYTLRWRDDLDDTDHLFNLEDKAEYIILQMAEIGRRGGLHLLCKRILP